MFKTNELKTRLNQLIWGPSLDDLPWPHAALLRVARILYVVVQELIEGQLTLRAMSLVYTTLLSLVPLLAVSFSVLKAFGVQNQLEPMLLKFLQPMGERGVEITERIVGFVSNIRAGVLGSVGLVLLFYTVISLLQKIEHAFNYTWHVSDVRSLAQRFSDYLSVIIVGPVLVFSAVGLTASAMSTSIVTNLLAVPVVGALFEAIGRLVPYLLIVMAFTLIYVLVPNTRVRVRSALVGGLVAGVLWQTTGWAFAAFVVTSAKYTAIYSAFAALIVFMMWLYLGWLILLVGASIAFYHQYPAYLRPIHGALRLNNKTRERLALQAAALIARAFHHGAPPTTEAQLARQTAVPQEAIGLITAALRHAGLICDTQAPVGLIPTRSLDQIRLVDVLDAVRGEGIASELCHPRAEPLIEELMETIEGAIDGSLRNLTLEDLAEPQPHPAEAPTRDAAHGA